ncbi:MAG: hypothetical protein IPJ75_08320 [Ignavibacteriales bacterium]|nr:hypothetical protein [Ignavibacteriales bacterium]
MQKFLKGLLFITVVQFSLIAQTGYKDLMPSIQKMREVQITISMKG